MEGYRLALQWYAVHVRSNQERTTADFIRSRAIQVFLPTYQMRSARRDRNAILTRPLFPGYVFVRIDIHSSERIEVLKAPGTVRIVSFGNDPPPVPDSVIESIRILVGNGSGPVRPHPSVCLGASVEVIDGPFKGAIGLLSETEDKKPKLVVKIEFLGRAVAVPIAPDQVQPATR
jgi:transcription antitermination factor NusG